MKLILLNGPPRCGKDTATEILYRHFLPHYSVRREKFSFPHKLAFAAMTKRFIDSEGNVDHYEQHKSEVIPWLGVSYRQWQIDFSECFMKPLYGKDIFVRMFLERVSTRKDADGYLCLVSDCGFQIEFNGVAHKWNSNDIALLTIMRDGCTFDGDSRGYVHPHHHQILYKTIYNNGTPDEFKTNLLEAVEDFLK